MNVSLAAKSTQAETTSPACCTNVPSPLPPLTPKVIKTDANVAQLKQALLKLVKLNV